MNPTHLAAFVQLLNKGLKHKICAPDHSKADIIIKGVAVDTRLLKQDDVFFALPGACVDGHAYIGDAASKGAAAAVILNSYTGPDYGLPLIRVDDVLSSLQNLATTTLQSRKSRIIAVTGSVGKTTTKDFITTLLREKFVVSSSPGNSNSQIGLPLSILNHTRGDEEFLILEMGMTHPGQISELVKIAPPHHALITSVEYAHAVNFSSIEDIARAKAELFSSPHTQLGILPLEIPNFHEAIQTGICRKLTFSMRSREADYYLEEAPNGIIVHAESQRITLPIPSICGKHNLHNLLAAITMARSLSLDWESIADAVPKLSLPERRLQHVEKDGILFINDSYNAIPVAVKAALTSLPAPKSGGKRIFVMGEMLELGMLSDKMHQEVGELALSCVDRLLCFGDACKPTVESWKVAKRSSAIFNDFDELVAELKKHVQPGDVVLLKGSRRKALWRVLEAFDGANS